MASQPLLPRSVNTQLAAEYLKEGEVRFIKNLTLKNGANGLVYGDLGLNEEKQKPLQSNEIYAPVNLPEGVNYAIFSKWFDVTNEVYVFAWNSLGNHFLYKINCGVGSVQMVKIDKNFKFSLTPEYFIHENGCTLQMVKVVDPETGNVLIKKDLYWTDGLNYQGYLRIDDCIATNGFDDSKYPYFKGDYDRDILIRMGVPSLDYCISISEVPTTSTSVAINNDLLYKTWKFRARGVDIFGRPTEHGIIAFYVPGINDCLSSSDNVPRCLNLGIRVTNPFIDTVDIEYLNDNGTVWYKADTVQLYTGNKVTNWWLRNRNPDLVFNSETSEIIYTFCANRGHEAVPIQETSRLYNPIPLTSQCLLELNKRIALVNNKILFNPLSQDLLKKISFSIEYPKVNTKSDLVSITIDVPIYNNPFNNYQQVRKDGASGYIWGDNNPKHGGSRAYSQYFKNILQSGWIGYLNDGDSCISKQYYVDASGNLIEDTEFNGLELSPTKMVFQRFTFSNKQKGKYIFRLASHLTDPSVTGNFQSTSTTVWGVCPYTKSGAVFNIQTSGRLPKQELFIDCCDGNYETMKNGFMLVIADLAAHRDGLLGTPDYKATCGYINSTNKNGFPEFPVELMSVTNPNTPDTICKITDHNGFYWYETSGEGRTFSFSFIYKCNPAQFTQSEGGSGMRFMNYVIEDVNDGAYSDYSSLGCNYILIKGRAFISGTNIGASNAVVTLSRGGFSVTDNDGNFSILAHDYTPDYKSGRSDELVFSSSCIYHSDDDSCVGSISVKILPCSICVDRVVNVLGWNLTVDNFRGLLSGGNYLANICLADWLGRRTYVQAPMSLNIPSVAQTGVIAPCKVKVNIATDAVFPTKFKWFTLFISSELNYADYLEWVVDEVIFVDNTGNENNVNPTQIKIRYNSLNEFNKQNYFSTTCAWQFIVQSSSNPVVGDKVQFIVNGDGILFTSSITSLVKYDSEGQFILIDYKPSLKDLKSGAKMRLLRPKESYSDSEPMYEICDSRVDLINGVPDRFSFYLNAADTYYLPRQIPVPSSLNNLTEGVTKTTTIQDGNTTTSNAVTTTQPVAYSNQLKSFGFYFEHHSPSNLWGLRCWNYGRVNTKNIDEAELVKGDNVCLSGESLSTGLLTYLQYFDSSLSIDFDVPDTGGITGALVMPGAVLWITQHGNYMTGYNDNLLRQNSDGTISASVANGFGKPDTIPDYKYGCLLRDKNTIGVKDDVIVFVDGILGELVGLRPRSTGGTIHFTRMYHDIFFNDKIRSMIGTNRYFHKGINPLTNEYLLTDFNLDSISYVNNDSRWYDSEKNETMSFDVESGKFLGHFSFTPEMYAGADGDKKHKQLFSFKNAVPYNHYNINQNTSFNTFYGVKCERVLVIVGNGALLTEKYFKSIEVYSRFLYWAFKIVTESGQLSRLTKSQWIRTAKFYKAAFLCDINTPDVNNEIENKLFNGNVLYGRYITVFLVGDAKDNSRYNELAGTIIHSVPVEKSGVNEQ